jgi:cytochrome o ubiquinol oxidase subunit 1
LLIRRSASFTSPGVGVDYYLWSLQIPCRHTVDRHQFRHHDPENASAGMGDAHARLRWTALASNLMIVAVLPILTATFAMLKPRPLPRLPLLRSMPAATQ